MKHLKKRELQEISDLLRAEREKIVAHLKKLSESQEILDANPNSGDSADIAHLEISQSNLSKIGSRELNLLKKIDESLQKIQNGTYGLCEECGEPIPFKRLLVRPVAVLCVECKNQQELREKRYSSKISDEEEDVFEVGDEPSYTSVIEEE
ncbi:MAG: TraR/DksA family transcriptional regulator [Deltaproteobacteria bacterium]|nr:TraR/DksA family transcriptional regulator [Deltaproteobacteria bacterium]